jgi:beta-lactamase regulating signal transducer with metallopeptidase domain
MKTFLNSQWTEAVGLTILDSLWQGALVLLFCFFILLFMKKARPAYRFNLVLIALISLPMLSGITLYRHLDFSQVESSVPLEVSIDFTSVPQDFIATDSPKTVAIEPLAKQSPYSFWLRWTAQNADIALAIWLIGALLFTIRMLGGFIFLNRLKTKAKLIEDSALLINLDQFCKQLKIKGKVLLKQSEAISSPLVMGVLKPVIIFPLGLIQALPTEEIEAILLHELAHIKRNDFLINIVINVLQVVYFYHPAFWWLNAQLDDEREYDCDESTVLLTSNPLVLAKALTRISEFNLQPSTPALAFAGRRNQMLKRIKRIVQRQPQTNWLSGLLSFSLLLLSFFLMSTNTGMNDNLNLEEKAKDPIEVQKVQFQDTAKINKAILEILKPNSRISIRPNENGGRPLIFLDKEEITGEEYAIYLAAYDQIQDFRHEVSSEYSGILKFSLKDNLDSSKFRLPTEEEWKSKIDSARSEYDLIEYKNWIKGTYNIIEIDLDSISINNGILESALKGTGLRVERLNKKDSDFTAEIMFNGEVDTNNNKILFEKNGEILNGDSSIKQLDPNLIQKISVIKNKSEIAQLSLDTTLVEGIIRIVTKPNVDWKAATNSSSPRVRLRGITVITVKDEKSDQERIRDREPIKVPVEVNGVRGASLEDINPADIKSLSVIKNDAELHERNYDTTQVEGIIIIETNKVGKRKVEERLQGKSTFSITTESPDYSIVLFDDVVPEKFQFDAISRQLKDTKPMIEMDGKLYPEMTFKDLSDFGVAKLKIMEIFKGDKMYDFYKKRELRGRDVLLKIITK